MSTSFISEMYNKALAFKDKNKGWFTAMDLAKKIKCAPRTSRFYVKSMVEQGLIERKNTFPSLSYKTVKVNKKNSKK